jgi:hypothetical protein
VTSYYKNYTDNVWEIVTDYITIEVENTKYMGTKLQQRGKLYSWGGTLYVAQWDTEVEPGYDDTVWESRYIH